MWSPSPNSPWSTRIASGSSTRRWIVRFKRPRAVHRVVAFGDDEPLGGLGELDVDLALLQTLEQPADLDVDDLRHVLDAERVEEDDLVDAVEELRPEVLPQRLA